MRTIQPHRKYPCSIR